MAETTNQLELRNAAKKKKYVFIVKESKFSSGVKKRWRFPRGKHSQVRQMHKGKPPLPGPGYGSPKSVRGLSKEGLKRVVVSSIKDLEGLDSSKDGVVLSRTLGGRKSLTILTEAQNKKLQVLNVADITLKIKSINDALQMRKKNRLEKMKSKTKKKKDDTKEAKKETKKDKPSKEVKKEEQKATPVEKVQEKSVETTKNTADVTKETTKTKSTEKSIEETINTKTEN